MTEQQFVSIRERVNMVSRNYRNLGDMCLAHERLTESEEGAHESDASALLKLCILVHVYLKINKPDSLKDRIVEIWNGLCQD